MKDSNTALDSLQKAAGLNALQFNADGVASVMVDKSVGINIVRIDDANIEFVTYFDLPDFSMSYFPLRAMLHANYMGEATGSARLALDPRDDQLLLCDRVDVTTVDDDGLKRRFVAFIDHAAFWNSPEAHALVGPIGDKPDLVSGNETIIRI